MEERWAAWPSMQAVHSWSGWHEHLLLWQWSFSLWTDLAANVMNVPEQIVTVSQCSGLGLIWDLTGGNETGRGRAKLHTLQITQESTSHGPCSHFLNLFSSVLQVAFTLEIHSFLFVLFLFLDCYGKYIFLWDIVMLCSVFWHQHKQALLCFCDRFPVC